MIAFNIKSIVPIIYLTNYVYSYIVPSSILKVVFKQGVTVICQIWRDIFKGYPVKYVPWSGCSTCDTFKLKKILYVKVIFRLEPMQLHVLVITHSQLENVVYAFRYMFLCSRLCYFMQDSDKSSRPTASTPPLLAQWFHHSDTDSEPRKKTPVNQRY